MFLNELTTARTFYAHGRSLEYCIHEFGLIMQQALSRFYLDPRRL